MTISPQLLRRYVIDRAAGRAPHAEWSYLSQDIGAWILADETSARQHEHHRRVRKRGQSWCDVLGHCTVVRDDIDLQMYFATIAVDEWSRLAIDVMRRPSGCLREWRASGNRLIAAVDPTAAPPPGTTSGPLSGWPPARGTGPRSMLPR